MTNTTMPSLRDQAESLLARIKSTDPDHEPFSISFFVERLLAHYGRIAVTWEIVDVQGIRPDLTREQAWEVLEKVADHHDAEWGISWTTLQTVANDMFDRDDTTNEAKEVQP